MQTFISSDYHFSHSNIIKYDNRPFSNLEEMNSTIIRKHNERVKPEDTVYFLGDLCVAGTTYIDTPNGKKQISSLKNGDKVYSVNISNNHYNAHNLDISEIKQVLKSKSVSRLNLFLENSKNLKITENHPVAISQNNKLKWVNAGELKVGDILFEKKDVGYLIKKENSENYMYKTGYILGYILGDGHFESSGCICIDAKDLDGLKRIVKYIKELYNANYEIKNTKKTYYRLRIKRNIVNSLNQFRYDKKKINVQYQGWYRGFLAGFYDAEGSLTFQKNNWYIKMSNTNKDIYNFLKNLIQYFQFSYYEDKPYQPKGKKHYKICYTLKLKTSETCKFLLLCRPAFKRKYPDLKILANGVKIIKILNEKPKYHQFKNYNLTVEPNNNYIANGILVHNCFYASENRAFRGEGQPYKPEDFLNKMNGKYWNFVKGNHDKPGNKFHPKNESIILNQNGVRIQLIHDPLYAKIDYDLILCGHVHMAWKLKELSYCGQKRLIINVSCCLWDYYPVRLDELLAIYYKWSKEKLPHWKTSKLIYEYNQGTLAEKNKESYEK